MLDLNDCPAGQMAPEEEEDSVVAATETDSRDNENSSSSAIVAASDEADDDGDDEKVHQKIFGFFVNPSASMVTHQFFPSPQGGGVGDSGDVGHPLPQAHWVGVQFRQSSESVATASAAAAAGSGGKVMEVQQSVKKSRRGPRSRSSQYRGVTFYRRTGRWESHIWFASIFTFTFPFLKVFAYR